MQVTTIRVSSITRLSGNICPDMCGTGVVSKTLPWEVHQPKAQLRYEEAQWSWVIDLTFISASISSPITGEWNAYVVIIPGIKYCNKEPKHG